MNERTLHLPRVGGVMDVFVVEPVNGPAPLVIMYMDMWGMREVLRNLARRVAQAGYCCVLPDLYYRGGVVRYANRDDVVTGKSFSDLTPERQAALQAAMAALSDAMVIEDTQALLDYFRTGSPGRRGAVGAIGYCMGGRHALCVAGGFPDQVKAAACLHGAYLTREGADSPHRVVKNARGEIYLGHAAQDKYAPEGVVDAVNAQLKQGGVRYKCEVHAGAQHGYAIPDRDVYDEHAANRDWVSIFDMFKRQLV